MSEQPQKVRENGAGVGLVSNPRRVLNPPNRHVKGRKGAVRQPLQKRRWSG